MAGVVQSVIYNEGVPYLTKETVNYIKGKIGELLRDVDQWLIKASQYGQLGSVWTQTSKKMVNGKMQVTTTPAMGINYDGTENTNLYLSRQFDQQVSFLKDNSPALKNPNNVTLEWLLKEGYKILTKLGEAIRGDTVDYKIFIYGGSALGINSVDEFNVNLEDFLGKATVVNARGELVVASKTHMINNQLKSKSSNMKAQTNFSLDLNKLNKFIAELRGYFLFSGRHRNHIFAGASDELKQQLKDTVKTINLGHVFETVANYPEVLSEITSITDEIASSLDWVQVTEAENYWASFDENTKSVLKPVQRNLYKISRIFQTLQDPSPFWQGGEGGPNLANTQVKSNRAGVTNLSTLVRQMIRVSSMVHSVSQSRISQRIKAGIRDEDYDEKIVEGLLKMFDRRFTGHYQWEINF